MIKADDFLITPEPPASPASPASSISMERAIIRVDERTKAIQDDVSRLRIDIKDTALTLAVRVKETADDLSVRVKDTADVLSIRVKDTADALDQKVKDTAEALSNKIQANELHTDERINLINLNHKALALVVDTSYVRKTEFSPIQKIVYGLVGLILTAVVLVLLSTIFKPTNLTFTGSPTVQQNVINPPTPIENHDQH